LEEGELLVNVDVVVGLVSRLLFAEFEIEKLLN